MLLCISGPRLEDSGTSSSQIMTANKHVPPMAPSAALAAQMASKGTGKVSLCKGTDMHPSSAGKSRPALAGTLAARGFAEPGPGPGDVGQRETHEVGGCALILTAGQCPPPASLNQLDIVPCSKYAHPGAAGTQFSVLPLTQRTKLLWVPLEGSPGSGKPCPFPP